MNSTGIESVNTAQGYTQGVAAGETPETKTGRSRSGHDVTQVTSAPVLRQEAATANPACKKGVSIGKRLVCPFATAGNLFVRTVFSTARRAFKLAGIPGLMAGGIAGFAVSTPVAGTVKLVKMLARTNTKYGSGVIKEGTSWGALMGGFTTGGIGAFAGALAGVGLGIVGGLIGFGKGVRDAVTGDVHRLEREKLTLKNFFEQIGKNKKKTKRGWQELTELAAVSQHSDATAGPSVFSTAAPESPGGLRDDQNPFDFSRVKLDFLPKKGRSGAV